MNGTKSAQWTRRGCTSAVKYCAPQPRGMWFHTHNAHTSTNPNNQTQITHVHFSPPNTNLCNMYDITAGTADIITAVAVVNHHLGLNPGSPNPFEHSVYLNGLRLSIVNIFE